MRRRRCVPALSFTYQWRQGISPLALSNVIWTIRTIWWEHGKQHPEGQTPAYQGGQPWEAFFSSFLSCTWERPCGPSFAWAIQGPKGGKINPAVCKAKLCAQMVPKRSLGTGESHNLSDPEGGIGQEKPAPAPAISIMISSARPPGGRTAAIEAPPFNSR